MLRSWTQYALLVPVVCLLLIVLSSGTSLLGQWQYTGSPPELQDNLEGASQWQWQMPAALPSPSDNPYGGEFFLRQHQKYSRKLVVASISNDTIGWIKNGLSDVEDLGFAIYVVDDENSWLKVPANKGNEAMVYLTFIIDNYDSLPDVSVFMHAHGEDGVAWHNEELLDRSSLKMVRHLSAEKVVRDGFVQLKCEHDKTCASDTVYLHKTYHPDPWEEDKGLYLAAVWQQLFPRENMPDQVINPVGAQFAVSRDAIRRRSKLQYENLRNYLLNTHQPSRISGRVFEWIWAYIFTSNIVHCPNKLLCFCDTYSICFRTQHDYAVYDSLYHLWDDLTWAPPADDDEGLASELHDAALKLQLRLQRLKDEATFIGSDEQTRQQILHDNWELMKADNTL